MSTLFNNFSDFWLAEQASRILANEEILRLLRQVARYEC